MPKGWGAAAAAQREAKKNGITLEPVEVEAKVLSIPPTEKPGFCSHCAGASFQLISMPGGMKRRCEACRQLINVMTMEVLEQGNTNLKYNGGI